MFKFITALFLVAFSSISFAGAKGGFNDVDNSGIITPDIATGMRSFNYYTYTVDGHMAVCQDQDVKRYECTKWSQISEVIPPNRKFVGFKIVSRDYGYRQIEIYWK